MTCSEEVETDAEEGEVDLDVKGLSWEAVTSLVHDEGEVVDL